MRSPAIRPVPAMHRLRQRPSSRLRTGPAGADRERVRPAAGRPRHGSHPCGRSPGWPPRRGRASGSVPGPPAPAGLPHEADRRAGVRDRACTPRPVGAREGPAARPARSPHGGSPSRASAGSPRPRRSRAGPDAPTRRRNRARPPARLAGAAPSRCPPRRGRPRSGVLAADVMAERALGDTRALGDAVEAARPHAVAREDRLRREQDAAARVPRSA